MEGNLHNSQRDQAMMICANALAIQVPELKNLDIKSGTDIVLDIIIAFEQLGVDLFSSSRPNESSGFY